MLGNGTPLITSISQASGQRGETLQQAVITGAFTHFTRGMPIVTFSDPGLVAANVAVIDDTHVRADLTVTPAALRGRANITIETGSEVAIGAGLFNVGTATALITNANPPSGERSQPPFSVTISGSSTHFVQGQSILILSNSGLVASSVTVIDPSHLTAVLSIAANAPAGTSDITVKTGAEVAMGTGKFIVAPRTPLITMVSPASGQQGQTLMNVSITGAFTQFTHAHPNVTFSNPGITASNVHVVDDRHLTATFNITPTAGTATTVASDTSGSSQKATNTYAILGSRLSDLTILIPIPAGVSVEHDGQTLVTFSLTDDQAKAFKTIIVRHSTDEPLVVPLPPPPAAPSATPPKPSIKAQPPAGIAIGTTSLTVTGTGMSQVISVRYLDAPLTFTSSSDTVLTIRQLPTLAPPGIDVVFVYADKSMASYFIPVQTPGPQ
jgi:hypothetical protein